MPRAKSTPGRKRKFKNGDIAYHRDYGWGVIVDWISYGGTNTYYRFVRVLHPFNGAPYGEAVWTRPHFMRKPTEDESKWNRTRNSVRYIYALNQKLEERGCRCNCCVHESIPRGQIMSDGTYRWEKEVEDE